MSLLGDNGEFDVGDAFEFLRQKEGRAFPKKYVLSVLKSGDISRLSIPEDLGDDEELNFIYKLLYAPHTLAEENLSIKGNMDLSECILLEELPQGLSVDGYLFLNRCISLRELPQGFSAGKGLCLNECTSLRELPEGFSVGENLWLVSCTSLRELPEGLSIDGWLWLKGCVLLEELPKGLFVGGNLHFELTDPIPQRFSGDKNAIKKYIEKEISGEVKGEICI